MAQFDPKTGERIDPPKSDKKSPEPQSAKDKSNEKPGKGGK